MPNAYQKRRQKQTEERLRLEKTRPKKVKVTKRALNEEYGVPRDHKLRWAGLEGVAWYWLSIVRRKEDARDYGRCVSCPAKLDWNEGDGGHYISVSRSRGMRLHEDNVYLQCKRCNNPTWSPDSSVPFGYEIDRRKGANYSKKLYELSRGFVDTPSAIELLAMIGDLRERANAL